MMIGKQEHDGTYSYVGMIRRKDREMWLSANCETGRYILYVKNYKFRFSNFFRLKRHGKELAMSSPSLHTDQLSFLSPSVHPQVFLFSSLNRFFVLKL